MIRIVSLLVLLTASFVGTGQAAVYNGVMDNRTGFPLTPGFTAQSLAWATNGATGGGLRFEWQADNESTPGLWTYTYRLLRGSAKNKGFAFFDIETAGDVTSANIISRKVVAAHNRAGDTIASGLSAITIADPVSFDAVHDFSNAAVTERSVATALNSADLSHYSGDPGRVPPGQPGGLASPTPSVGPVPHPFYGIRVTFPGSLLDLFYEVSDFEFKIVSDRAPMWGSFFGWGDQTTVPPYWYANVYSDNIDNPVRLELDPADSVAGDAPYRGWILVPGPLPGVTATHPAVNATDVPFFEPINAVFNRRMDPATITSGSFNVSGITGSVSYDAPSRTATFQPASPLLPNTVYTATLTTAVRDLEGHSLPGPVTWSFATALLDTVPPTVTATLPANGAANVSTSTPIRVTFSEAMEPAMLTTANVTLTGRAFAAGLPVEIAATTSYDSASRSVAITPSAPLPLGTAVTAVVTAGASDRSGNTLAAPVSWSFSTIPDGIFSPGGTTATLADALRALKIAVNLLQPTQDDRLHGDVAPLGADGRPRPDGKVDLQDALVILRKAIGIIGW